MSERAHDTIPTPEGEYFEKNRFAGLSMLIAVVAVAGLAFSLVGAVLAPKQFAFSWLFGFTVCFALCAGCFFWTIVHHAVDAEWSVVVRRQLENIAALFPVLAVLFIPIILFRDHLFGWMTIPHGQDALLESKRLYLNLPFWLGRSIFYLLFFSLAALAYRKISIAQDRDGNPANTLRMRKLAFVFLPLFALSLSFAAYDWLAGLNYKWFSTMWGVYIFAGAAGSSMSLLVLVTTWLHNSGYLRETVTLEHYHIMGKWMLAFTVFWAYIGFSQYMLIWYANIPEETEWFILRNVEGWNLLSILLMVGRFWLPFAVLLLRSTKKNVKLLCYVAGWILFMQVLDMYIVVLPELHRTGVHFHILDLLPLVGIAATL
ncbi:MAG TPA: hypothetical protein VG095_08330, partial [Chthoniobacterales bacterium]|nr:hypothetical protein [Chthoniobacterales bacterium]